MPISIESLSRKLNPHKTVLVLGAGASIPSGAPSGADLAKQLWGDVAKNEPISSELIETATILCRKYSRREVVEVIIEKLKTLSPTGGILGLPSFPWNRIFSTNYDQLVEKAYKKAGKSIVAIRSNFDFTHKDQENSTKLYKMHGCISQDDSLGHKSSMILTEGDYEKHLQYRNAIFSNLKSSMLENDVLVVGQSLADAHLYNLVKKVLESKDSEGAPGAVYVLVFNPDDLRAPLLEDRGAQVAFGGIDELIHALASDFEEDIQGFEGQDTALPVQLVSATLDVSIELRKTSNVRKMFNGGPATYADIESSATFERKQHDKCIDWLKSGETKVISIIGAAGVGKTTFARQLGRSLTRDGFQVWEHRSEFDFFENAWEKIEQKKREDKTFSILILDECTHFLRQANKLIDYLSEIDSPGIRVIVTANAANWTPRLKSQNFFIHGNIIELSRLEETEISSLLNLLNRNSIVEGLVERSFKKLKRHQQLDTLRKKSSADMFVCLKNIFGNESLDVILLREYDELEKSTQDYYRYVSALESIGARVHRQLIIRMLRLSPQNISSVLGGLTGIVDEYQINEREGIYAWRTRHIVIARKISEYKFSGILENVELFENVISNLNPSIRLELQTIRDICDVEHGIGKIEDRLTRKKLYQKLIDLAPAERIPWHRLIRELLDEGGLEDVEYTIKNAEYSAGRDSPIDRYKVRLLMKRAETTSGISESDRLALMRKAYEQSLKNVKSHSWDKHSYYILCQVAQKLVSRGESRYVLEEALALSLEAAEKIADPDMSERLRQYEDSYLRR